MVQVLVKTTPQMKGHYGYDVERAAIPAFTARPDVWWYTVPEDDDNWDWHRGGAWEVPVQDAVDALIDKFAGPRPVTPPPEPEFRLDVKSGKADDITDDERW
jgi:hypothetical protein